MVLTAIPSHRLTCSGDKRHNPPIRPGQVTQTSSDNVSKSDLNGPVEVTLNLAGSVGVPEGHASTPSSLTVTLNSRQRESRSGLSHITGSPTMSIVSTVSGAPQRSFTPLSSDEDMRSTVDSWPFKEALQSRRLVLVEDCSNLIEGFGIRVWDELPNAAVVVPIANDSDEGIPSAVIVIGLSIRRPFDEEYESFLVSAVYLVSRLTTSARSTIATRVWHRRCTFIRSRATANRRACRARSGKEYALLQRQPRAPHASYSRRRTSG